MEESTADESLKENLLRLNLSDPDHHGCWQCAMRLLFGASNMCSGSRGGDFATWGAVVLPFKVRAKHARGGVIGGTRVDKDDGK